MPYKCKNGFFSRKLFKIVVDVLNSSTDDEKRELKILFRRKLKKRRHIDSFFEELHRMWGRQFEFYSMSQWTRIFTYMRKLYRQRFSGNYRLCSYFVNHLGNFSCECSIEAYVEQVYQTSCEDILSNNSILCKTCNGERRMRIIHTSEGKSTCRRCGQNVIVFYERCH